MSFKQISKEFHQGKYGYYYDSFENQYTVFFLWKLRPKLNIDVLKSRK